MAVQVPFHLIRRSDRDRCDALLLLSTEMRDLIAACERIGVDPLPPIFSVVGGYLIVLEEAPKTLPTRAIRLRRISENGFVPVDAELVPALHPDEAAALTRQRGLVFLPGNQCLSFHPDKPLDAVSLISVPQPKRDAWQPFPEGPELADQLTVIRREIPDITPDEVLNSGGAGIGEEAPRPPTTGPLKTIAGNVALAAGRGIAGLGVLLGLGFLARLGAKLIDKAVSAAPRLSESLLGRQEAALRALLRKFREGKIEEALKNALPMGANGEDLGKLHDTDQLPTHDVRWSLRHLLRSSGRASLWLGGIDVQRELTNEYRKAVQATIERGDFRRAAFIYGKLLALPRLAADVLAQGGMHHDSAILFRDLLKDTRSAAREFEAAREWDEALRLYRQLGDHEQAGDLLRRMGEEERAIDEYHWAAKELIDSRSDFLKAGELMLRKTGQVDLAEAYFAQGWRERGPSPALGSNAIPCAVHLAEIYASAEPLDPLWKHIDEVDEWLSPPGQAATAAVFFNAVAKLADLPHLSNQRSKLRDRAKLALAAKLREHPKYENRPGQVGS